MLGTYFYHEIIRKTIISFGTLFNDISIRHTKSDGTILDETKVGLSYGPMQKFLAKIQEQEQLTKSIAITLPRMSFEMTSIDYDSTRGLYGHGIPIRIKTPQKTLHRASLVLGNKWSSIYLGIYPSRDYCHDGRYLQSILDRSSILCYSSIVLCI